MSKLARSVRSPKSWRKGSGSKQRPNSRPSSYNTFSYNKNPRQRSRRVYNFGALFSRRLIARLIIVALILAVAGGTFLTFAIAALSRNLPEPGRLIDRSITISTKIYDRTGKILLYDLHDNIKRTLVPLDQIAPYAIKAALVAEDRNFYNHGGFDLRGIVRSIFLNFFSEGPLRGGSTITQQFVKNAILTNEKTYTRKLKELVLSYRIEKEFTKDEILGMYFNEIPYGSTIYGIEAASQSFFQKPASELDLLESATLAAIPNAPTRLSPYGSHTDELVARVQYILRGMVEEKYITQAEVDKYLKEDPLSRVKPQRDNLRAPHFVFYARDLLAEQFGEDFVKRGGLNVITTLDWKLQQIAEEEVLRVAKINEEKYGGKNAALIAQDVKTGQILAMVGSRDYFDETIDGQVNVALRPRQPGSSFKPIVYSAAFEKGFTADTPLWDVVTTFKAEPKDYEPHNYDGKEHGLVNIRKAFAGSLNIPAVKTIYLTGIDRVLDLADRMGYTTLKDRSRFGLSLVLGGGEVKLIEHVGAFSALANDGNLLPQTGILRIEDSSGRVLKEWKDPQSTSALDKTIAREIIDIMSDNSARAYIFGNNNLLTLPDRPTAAKTGTTNDFHDGWTLGFTPSLAVGIWAGNSDNVAMNGKADGSVIAAPIWNAFMRRALENTPVEQFPKPDPRPVVNPILRGQGAGSVTLKIDKITGLLATDNTPAETTIEKTYQSAHSILFYIDKDDLSAPQPINPGKDPNFENWENAVRHYAEEHRISNETPPTLYDNVHTPENKPSINFIQPSQDTNISGDTSIELNAFAPRGITKVELYIDDKLIKTLTQTPYSTTLSPSSIPNGIHLLRAIALDDVLNRAEASVQISK